MYRVTPGGAPPNAPSRLQTTTTTPSPNTQAPPRADRDSFEPAPRRTATTPASFLEASGGGGGLRSSLLGGLRATIGDLDSPGAALALEAMKGQQFPGLELGLVAQKGDRVVYVDAQGKLADLRVNGGNAQGVMDGIKAADEALHHAGSSYDLRKAVVERSDKKVSTADGYTYLQPMGANGQRLSGSELKQWRTDPANWLPERRAIQEQIAAHGLERAEALSALAEPNTIYALRGNTAAGKSSAVRTNPQFQGMAQALDGAINPDTYKFGLRQADAVDGRMTTASRQVHEEGSVIAARIEKAMLDQPGSSVVFDKRFHEPRDIPDLLDKARANGKSVKIVDIDAPLELSAARVLTRKANSPDPLVPFGAIAEGFAGIRQNRGPMLFGPDSILRNPLVRSYELYVVDDHGKPEKVASKQGGELVEEPGKEALVDRATAIDTDLEAVRDQEIDDAFIERMARFAPPQFRDGMRTALEDFRGQKLGDALEAKSQQINDPGQLSVRKAV